MANLEVATNADVAVVLPCLVLAKYVDLHGPLSNLTTTLYKKKLLPGVSSVRLVTDSGASLSDLAVVQYLADAVNTTTYTLSRTRTVGCKFVFVIDLVLTIITGRRMGEAKC
jgi:hypothetical protein